MNPNGRPVKWTPEKKCEIVETICLEIAHGKSLKSLVDNDDLLPSYSSFMAWLIDSPEFLDKYQSAMSIRTDLRVDEITDISDQPPDTYRDVNGETRIDPAFVAWQKNRMDARKWEASKLKPKKYGDKVDMDLNHSGSVLGAGAKLTVELVDARASSEADADPNP